jgi:hypothetical protein
MEHHQCFHIYILKTRATRISDTVFFKHQYITNPQVTPKTLIIKAALDLTSTLKGMISCDDRRGAPKVQLTIHKDSHGEIKIGKGKIAIEQPSKSPK